MEKGKKLTSIFSVFKKNIPPKDIAWAVSLALVLAIIPKDNLLWPILFVFCCFVHCKKLIFFVCLICFSLLVPFLDVMIERLGFYVLSLEALQSFYIMLDKIPFVGLTRFYNTMVAGGIFLSLIVFLPVFFLTLALVKLIQKRM